MCIMCRKVLAHPSGTGTSSMHDHNMSSACPKARKINRYHGWAWTPLGIEVLTLLQKGTGTGNKRRIIDLATRGGFNQHDFDEYFLKVFLATNLAFNCSKNLAFRHVFKYIRPGVEIPSATTLTRRLKRLGKSTLDDIRICLPAAGKISLAADTWTSPNNREIWRKENLNPKQPPASPLHGKNQTPRIHRKNAPRLAPEIIIPQTRKEIIHKDVQERYPNHSAGSPKNKRKDWFAKAR